MSHWLHSGTQNCRKWGWKDDTCIFNFQSNVSNVNESFSLIHSNVLMQSRTIMLKWDKIFSKSRQHTHPHTPELHKRRLRTSKPSPSVFIMWRASCYTVTPPLSFVHWKHRVEIGKGLGGIIRQQYPSKHIHLNKSFFDVMLRESLVG